MQSLPLSSSVALFVATFLAAGCSGTTAGVGSSSSGSSSGSGGGDALFVAPEGEPTAGSIYGVWGGALEDNGITFDTRWRFRDSELTLATRCTLPDGRESGTVSVTAKARVTDEEITILESKNDEQRSGDFVCRASTRPRTLSACSDREGFERECFRLSATKLTIYESPIEKLDLVKLSD